MNYIIVFLFSIVFFRRLHYRHEFTDRFILLFCALWFLDLLMLLFDVPLVGGIKPSIMALVVASLLSFVCGFLTLRVPQSITVNTQEIIDRKVESLFSSNLVKLFYLLLLGYVIFQFIKVLPILILNGNMGDGLRVDALTGQLYSAWFYKINTYVLAPVYNLTIPLCAYLFITGKKQFCFVITLLYCLIYPSLFGGRTSFFVLALVMLLCYMWCTRNDSKYLRKNFNKFALIMGGSVVFLFVFMTIAKMGDVSNFQGSFNELKEKFITQPVQYFSCPVKAFEYGVTNDIQNQMGGYLYGRATFASLDFYINPIINSLNGVHDPNANSTIGYVLQNEWIFLSQAVPDWNALYTALMHFYLDFGWFGCLMFSFFFGLIAKRVCRSVMTTASLPIYLLSFFILSKCIMSIMSYYPVDGDIVPMFIYIIIWKNYEKRLIKV